MAGSVRSTSLRRSRPGFPAQGAELGRIICVVDCGLAERNPGLLAWYDACIHFSDVVLLNRREGVPNKWVGDFQARYKDQRYPCVVKLCWAGSGALSAGPSALRISQAFEDEPTWVVEGDDPEDDSGEDLVDGDEEEVEMVPVEDPYFERRPGGRRAKEIPDVAKFLDAKVQARAPAGEEA